jgi:FkbM family methyltransferase
MTLLKRELNRMLRRLGYEVRRTALGTPQVSELSGIDYRKFLELYLLGNDLSKFFFIQVGAHNGITNDSMFEFVHRFRLKGALVEPQAEAFRELQENYKGCDHIHLENIAISYRTGRQPLYTIKRDLEFLQYANQAASFDYEHVRDQLRDHLTDGASAAVRMKIAVLGLRVEDCIETQTVATMTLQDLLDKYGLDGYDFLQIDTEGFDYDVVKLANIPSYRPRLINYEHAHLGPAAKQECWDYLAALDYQMFTHGADTTAYARDSEAYIYGVQARADVSKTLLTPTRC